MVRNLLLFLLFFSCAATTPNTVSAQRNLFNKKKQPAPQTKERYVVDVVLPIDKAQMEAGKPQPLMNFYEGVKLGLQQLGESNIPLDVNVHIFDQGNMQTFQNFAYSRELKSSDLIVAPANGKDLGDMATYAREHQINFISALSPYCTDIERNEYFHIIQPTLHSNIEVLTKYCMSKFPKKKKIILFDEAKQYTQEIKEGLQEDNTIVSYDISYAPFDVSHFTKQLNDDEPTVVFINELNPKKINEFLDVLTKVPTNYQLEIFGMPTLYLCPSIKNNKSDNLTFYYTDPYYFDSNTAFVKKVNEMYYSAYNKPANEMVYRGYEIIVWYGNILNKYGTNFQYALYDNIDCPYTPYDVQEKVAADNKIDYFENKFLYIYKYNNGILSVIENN